MVDQYPYSEKLKKGDGMKEIILYNPISWITIFWLVAIFYSWCSSTFKLEGSWKNLDKSIHWRN